ncbi:MAG: RNA polymerase sigma factor [Saprospiraceae bacterium]
MTTELFKKDILPVKDKLYRLALRMLTNPAEAQDAVQEVLLKLWQQGDALQKIDNLEAWAMRITKNWCLDKLRSKHRRTEDLDQAPVQTDGSPSPQQKLEKKETYKKVHQLIQKLPEKQMMVVQLRDIEGMTYKEIEQTIDMPQNQIKVNLFRARQKLKALMTKTINYEV